MPALTIFRQFTTRPFAGDDLHIVCVILGVFRAIQFTILVPFTIFLYLYTVRGDWMYINEIPPWCPEFKKFVVIFRLFEGGTFADPDLNLGAGDSYTNDWDYALISFVGWAIFYFIVDVAWICMVWTSASIGTPTEPMRRDGYIRKLIIFKIFASNIVPWILLVNGIILVYLLRKDNYGCGDEDEPFDAPDQGAWYVLFCILLVTYAFELLVFPAMIVNKIVKIFRKIKLLDRSRVEGWGGKAERFEYKFGLVLKALQYLTRGKAGGMDLKNEGELKDFATNVMHMMNNEAKLDVVLSDMYVGMKMLARVQAEGRVEAIKKIAKKDKVLRQQLIEQSRRENERSSNAYFESDESKEELCPPSTNTTAAEAKQTDPFEGHRTTVSNKIRGRNSILVLHTKQNDYEVCEHDLLLETNSDDVLVMKNAAHFAKYASAVYFKLRDIIVDDFMPGLDTIKCFTRSLDTLFRNEYALTSIGYKNTALCHMNLENDIVSTPYAILVDNEVGTIVIVVRGTRSLEDLVVDLQYIPQPLGHVGEVCGFSGEGHFCHQGFLTRSKWMYNDIKKSQVLKTLYSEESPFKNYSLVVCGHSLGAGCASILALMLRPAYPSLKCFAYEPPGCIFDDAMSKKVEDFIVSTVRNDDLVPRLSHHNFEMLRDEFCTVMARIKVPKINLFYDVRNPCSDGFLAQRNAKVLRPKENIKRETDFFQRLERLRAERTEKNNAGVNKTQLYIPGRIIHLVDTKGDDKTYVPYWASRHEFNQVVMSKRMLSDHNGHILVDVLRDIRLVGCDSVGVSLAFHDAPQIFVEDDEVDLDVRLFICCSNPYGQLPIVLSILSAIAFSMTNVSFNVCDVLLVKLVFTDASASLELNIPVGLYSYRLLECGETGVCEDPTPTDYCFPYPPGSDFDGYMQASRVFAILAALFGLIAMVIIWISMCYIIKKQTWKFIACMLLLASLFEGLVLLIKRSTDFCVHTGDSATNGLVNTCHLGDGGILAIVASSLWFVLGLGSMYLARAGYVHHS